MNTNKVKKLVKLIQEAELVTVNNSEFCDKSFAPIKGEPENEVVLLSWTDYEGLDFEVKLTEAGLSEADEYPEDGYFTCEDNEGDVVDISLSTAEPKTW